MSEQQPVALVTGAARRIGAAIVQELHAANWRVVIHCRHSRRDADTLADELNRRRADSVVVLVADLLDNLAVARLADDAAAVWGRLDLLVNNASSFYPTPVGATTPAQWDDLLGSNLRAPFFLSQAAAPQLARTRGAIVNITDIHAQRPPADHAVYCAAKAGLDALTLALARDLAPAVRVNGVAPGAILWPENDGDEIAKKKIIAATPLQRMGDPRDIAATVLFLARSEFVTGQILAVDGGRSL